jgi:hypothetical protein
MKRFDLSRAAPLALSLALSMVMSLVALDAIVAKGMRAAAALSPPPTSSSSPIELEGQVHA